MSEQIICDDCGKVIDPTEDHYQLTGSKVKVVDGVLTTVDPPQTLHYHVEHLPVYKIGGEDIVVPPEPPETETEPETETPAEPPETPAEAPSGPVPGQLPATPVEG